MKVTLLLLLCLVGMTVQQNVFWPFLPQSRFQYVPQLMNRNADQQESKELDSPVSRYNPFSRFYDYQHFDPVYPDQDARVRTPSDSETRDGYYQPAARFFLPWLFPYPAVSKTVYSFVSTMITSTTIKFCTEAAAFSNVISCRRRRETLFQLLEDREKVLPSPVDEVEVTTLPKAADVPVAREEPDVPVISGSLTPLAAESSPRKGRSFITTLTVTTLASSISTVTVTSTVRASAILASSTKLLCVPAGATVC